MRVKKKNTFDKVMANPRYDKLRVLPRSQVSEPTRSPYVVWSTKTRMIISEHPNKASAVSAMSKLRKDIKGGKYD